MVSPIKSLTPFVIICFNLTTKCDLYFESSGDIKKAVIQAI